MVSTDEITQRVFLVGCPRSGTTVLQNILSRHPSVLSLPETHFFQCLEPRPWLRRLGIASRSGRRRFNEAMQHLGYRRWKHLHPLAFTVNQYGRAFVAAMDNATKEAGQTVWIEKTPSHVLYIDLIRRFIEDAKFVHIVRGGCDVVASLYDVSHRFPTLWSGGEWSIDKCVDVYIRCVEATLEHLGKNNHFCIRYESLIREPSLVVSRICGFLDLPFEESLLEPASTGSVLVKEDEPWKKQAVSGIIANTESKFLKVFSADSREHIRRRLAPLDATLQSAGFDA